MKGHGDLYGKLFIANGYNVAADRKPGVELETFDIFCNKCVPLTICLTRAIIISKYRTSLARFLICGPRGLDCCVRRFRCFHLTDHNYALVGEYCGDPDT